MSLKDIFAALRALTPQAPATPNPTPAPIDPDTLRRAGLI
jgi:hypothetical protein